MTRITIEVDEHTHSVLLDLQVAMKKKKEPRSALNQIAADLLKKALETKKPSNQG